MGEGRGKTTILVVEDDQSLRQGLVMNLELKGYGVISAVDGESALQKVFDERPDLVILDIMLPVFSGLEVLDEIRRRDLSVPVLILSARGRVEQRVEGLKLGADDYLPKPFDLAELFARIEALLRRDHRIRERKSILKFGDIVVDQNKRQVLRQGRELELTAKEFDLLCLLASNPGRIFNRETILDRVWGWTFEGTQRTVDNFIMTLRRKLEEDPAEPKYIHTVRQVGYMFEPHD